MSKELRRKFESEGRRAESYAASWLRFRGYKILERRYKTREGEIDLIARKGGVLACIEVKQRSQEADAQEAVGYRAEQRIMNTAEIYVNSTPDLLNEDFELRFDILYVIGRWRVRHIPDAFRNY
ncbi:MAG: YraN family protein [Litorimonas sp.]